MGATAACVLGVPRHLQTLGACGDGGLGPLPDSPPSNKFPGDAVAAALSTLRCKMAARASACMSGVGARELEVQKLGRHLGFCHHPHWFPVVTGRLVRKEEELGKPSPSLQAGLP